MTAGQIMERDLLLAENAKLHAQLAEAEAAIEEIASITMSMVVNVQHMSDERGRIAREYLVKHQDTNNAKHCVGVGERLV